jgi:hypothetical protein
VGGSVIGGIGGAAHGYLQHGDVNDAIAGGAMGAAAGGFGGGAIGTGLSALSGYTSPVPVLGNRNLAISHQVNEARRAHAALGADAPVTRLSDIFTPDGVTGKVAEDAAVTPKWHEKHRSDMGMGAGMLAGAGTGGALGYGASRAIGATPGGKLETALTGVGAGVGGGVGALGGAALAQKTLHPPP